MTSCTLGRICNSHTHYNNVGKADIHIENEENFYESVCNIVLTYKLQNLNLSKTVSNKLLILHA